MGRFSRITGSVAALFALGALLAAHAGAVTIDAADGSEDSPITVTVAGSAVSAASLYVYAGKNRNIGDCALSASSQQILSGPPLIDESVGSGTFDASAEFHPKGPGKIRVCAYLTSDKDSIPIERSSGAFLVVSGKAYTPKLIRPVNGALSFERAPTLIWKKGPGKDTIVIYRGPKPRFGYAIARFRVSGTWRVSLSRRLPYGTYSWTVSRRDPRVGTRRTTPPRRFRVGPSPLRHLFVKLRTHQYSSIKRPGVSKVTIRSAPYARVRLRLRRNGHTVSVRSFRENRFNPKSRFSYPWRCSKTGSFSLKVAASDRYGHRRREVVRWNVSAARCAAMKRKAEERRKAKQKAESGSGEGGSCTPGYSPCLPPASDYDCAGGSGDGPEYVSGPVYVSGSDPYGLDSDGDGVGCE